ncbi:poly(3-hydroxybutyrate) depolymerase [Actimicrobium sp. GrIS 1.19]|uniref:alpha/beta fold hydrolase n=1 Tax=Actimicrobium sp. GrIS 1.19 TaxID=3071708 RepID=UPI002E090C25|nr:poly(3-hydroxybutyrate) depolymerase [Actimicrobium sp. GrIS 1.19]
MKLTSETTHRPQHEHSVPWFWPMAAAIELGNAGLKMYQDNLRYVEQVAQLSAPPASEWTTANRIALDLDTMLLRDFSTAARHTHLPVLIDAPYAGHSATIADFGDGQSLVAALQKNGLEHVFVTDWKNATSAMKDFNIDTYLTDLRTVIDNLGGKVHLVGLCQGGWMSSMFAARFPDKVATLVLAGAPIDTDAGDGPIKKLAHSLPLSVYQDMVAAGAGRMRGAAMLAGWKSMNPEEQYMGKYLELYRHIDDRNYIERTDKFAQWYENPLDLPGAYYLQAIQLIFKENQLAKGIFVGLGKQLSLRDIVCPVYLLAGEDDDITTREQVFDAEKYLGTPSENIVKTLAAGGHIGLFMGAKTLKECWPGIARWILADGLTAAHDTQKRA